MKKRILVVLRSSRALRVAAGAVLGLVVTALPEGLAAQRAVSLGVGGGVTTPQDDLEQSTDGGLHGMATLRVGVPVIPVHLRGDVMLGKLDGSPVGGGDFEFTHASVNVGYDILPLAVVNVYAIAGAGYYWTKLGGDAERDRSGGWNAGGGVRLNLGALRLFAEARYHSIDADGVDVKLVPVTVGLMF
jgi:hypothetical protein